MTPSDRSDRTRDLVLAAVQDYDWERLRPFVESLAAAGYRGETRFFVSGVPASTLAELRRRGVVLERARRLRFRVAGHVVQPYDPRTTRVRWHLQPLYGRAVRGLALASSDRRTATARFAGALANVEVARYFWYWLYLSRNRERYRNVMLTDVRDVLFLADPFDFETGGAVCSFAEDERFTIARQVNNRGWLHGAYGQAAVDELGDRPIVCSGVTIGAAQAVFAYLTEMVDRLARLARQYKGMDQGVHNYVLHKGFVPNSRIVPNRHGPVLTVGLMTPDDAVAAVRERRGELRVVHQYDRHPELARLLAGRVPAGAAP